MPKSAGVIIPNNQIDKFAEGGVLEGDILTKFIKLSEICLKLILIKVKNKKR